MTARGYRALTNPYKHIPLQKFCRGIFPSLHSLAKFGHLRLCKLPLLQVLRLDLQGFLELWQSADFVSRQNPLQSLQGV